MRSELSAIYTASCPERLPQLDSILAKFVGKEDELLEKVRRKYAAID